MKKLPHLSSTRPKWIAFVFTTLMILTFASQAEADSPPYVEWLRQFGATGSAYELAEAADSDGNVYIAGLISGTLPENNSAGGFDAFIRKYDANGNELWSRQFGTEGNDEATGIAIYGAYLYIVGYTNGAFQGETNSGGFDVFVRKYDVHGNQIWTRQFGTPLGDKAAAVSANVTGIYVGGWTDATLPDQTSAGEDDAFIRKYDADGNPIWTRQFGSTQDDRITGVATDNSSVYVSGITGDDVFMRKYDVVGNLIWERQFGSPTVDVALDLAVDASGLYLSGATVGSFNSAGGTIPVGGNAGGFDAFVIKYKLDGSGALWTDQFGTGDVDMATSVAVNSTGVYVGGFTGGALPGQPNAGDSDAFVRRYSADGNVIWTRQFGTKDTDMGLGVSVDDTGVYLVGFIDSILPDQPSGEWDDTFVRKYNFDGDPLWTSQFGTIGPKSDVAQAVDSNGNAYLAGSTGGAFPGQMNAGAFDAYVRMVDANGIDIWTRQFGTSLTDLALGIAVDNTSVYVVGMTGGVLPNQSTAGLFDAFVRKYDLVGNEVWTRQFGTPALDLAAGVFVDSSGVYVAGSTAAAFPGVSNQGENDAFVRKYDLNGNELWTKQFGSAKNDIATSVSVAGMDGYVAGFIAEIASPGQTAIGFDDAFVRKFHSDNGNEAWTHQFGTPTYDLALSVSAVETGAYVAGATAGDLSGQGNTGGIDAFVRKYNSDGGEEWTRQFGTAAQDIAFGVAADAAGVNVAGSTGGLLGHSSAGADDAFVRRYSAAGNELWTQQFGTLYDDMALGISNDGEGIYTVGLIGGELLSKTQAGEGDAFIAKLGGVDLVLEKSGPANVVAGEEVIYSLRVTNRGPAVAHSVVVEDALPAGVTLIDSAIHRNGAAPAQCGGTSCSLGDVAINETITIQIRARVDADLPAGTTLTNQASVFSATREIDQSNNTAQVVSTVESRSSLTISKEDLWHEVIVGGLGDDSALYIVTIDNAGPSTAKNVRFTDIFPAGMSLGESIIVNASYAGAPTLCPNPGNAPPICDIGDLPAGERVELHITAQVDATVTGCDLIVTNRAEVTWSDSQGQHSADVAETTQLVCQGDLDLQKSGPRQAAVGDTITYVLTATNTGPSLIPAGEVTLEDLLPTGLNGGAVVAESGSCNFGVGNTSPWTNGGDFLAHSACVVEIEATVTAEACPAGILANEARIHDQDNNVDQAGWVTQVDCSTTLSINKTLVNGAELIAGTTMNFAITVANTGNVSAVGAELTDAIVSPSSADAAIVDFYISATDFGYAPSGGECTDGGFCNLPAIPPGGTVSVMASVRLGSNAGDADLDQRACVEADNAASTCAAVEGEIISDVNLGIESNELGESMVAGGDPNHFVISVWNNGPSDASNVVVTDTPFAPYFQLVGNLEPGSQPMSCEAGTCTIPRLKAGQSFEIYATIAARADTPPGNHDVNQVCITAVDADRSNTPCNTDASTIVVLADLTLQKQAAATVFAGETLTYTLTVVNNGPSDAQNVVVTDNLPAGVTFLSASASADDSSCDAGPNPVTCTIGTLPSGESREFEIVVSVANDIEPGSSLENNATVTANTPDSNSNNNHDSADTSILGTADLALSKDGPAQVIAGEQIVYTIRVVNNGPSTAQSVSVHDALPAGLTLLNATIQRTGSGPAQCGGAVCNLGDLAVGEEAEISLVARVAADLDEGSSLVNQATVFSHSRDEATDNNSDSAETVVAAEADLAIVKLDLMDPIQPTAGLVYEIAITNDGPSVARNIVVTDTLGPNLTYAGVSPACQISDDKTVITCTLDWLGAGSTARYLLAVTAGDVPDGTILTNQVSVTSDTADPEMGNNNASAETTVHQNFGPTADLTLTKESQIDTVDAGGLVTYTLSITNNGPQTATNVQVLELIPSGSAIHSTTIENPDFGSAFCTLGGICYLGTVGVDTVATVTVVLRVEKSFAATSLTNLASVIGDQLDQAPENNIDDATVTVMPADLRPALVVTKQLVRSGAAADGIITVGEPVTFTIAITNVGETAVINLSLEDSYDPAMLTFTGATIAADDTSPGALRWNDLLPGASLLAPGDVLSLAVRFEGAGSSSTSSDGLATNTATVSDATDTNGLVGPEFNGTASVQVTDPGVQIQKSLSGATASILDVGEEITFTIRITNSGDTRLVTIPVQDLFDETVLGFLSASIPPTDTPAGAVRWSDAGDLDPGEAVAVDVRFEVVGDASTITNVAEVQTVIDENGDTASGSSGQASVDVVTGRLALVSQDNGKLISWGTSHESNVAGYYILRKVYNSDEERVRINNTLIAAHGSASVYEYLDATADPQLLYVYWLEEVHTDNSTREYGPLLSGGLPIYLPFISGTQAAQTMTQNIAVLYLPVVNETE